MMEMPEKPRRIPFQYGSELAKFEAAFEENLRTYLNMKRSQLMPAENIQGYRHGTTWKSGTSAEVTEMQAHEHGFTIKLDDIIAHDIAAMRRNFLQLADDMHASVVRMMYSTLREAAAAAGNTLSMKDAGSGSHAKAFLEMLKTVEFGIDRHGKPSLPEIHASPGMVDAFLKDLKSQGPEFEREVEQVKQQKVAAALQREQERLSKFKTEA